jgi:hypothetical protein
MEASFHPLPPALSQPKPGDDAINTTFRSRGTETSQQQTLQMIDAAAGMHGACIPELGYW